MPEDDRRDKAEGELVQLGKEIALYKLYGSVIWAWEPHAPTLKIHDDVRAVFRKDDKFRTPAIIPPIPEKEMPSEFSQVWAEARRIGYRLLTNDPPRRRGKRGKVYSIREAAIVEGDWHQWYFLSRQSESNIRVMRESVTIA